MKRFLPPAVWLFLGIWLALLVAGRSRFFQDPGTFWHVRVGDKIFADGFFDRDPYTFSFHGETWIPQQWLGECILSTANALGGFDTLLLFACTAVAAIFAGLGVRLLRAGFHPSLVAVILACGIAASAGHFHVRPHLATIAGMAVTMCFLTDFENGRIDRRRLLWLLPIYWLWSNIHGGIMGGIATIALALAGWTLMRLLGRTSPIRTRRDFWFLAALWLGTIAVCFLNPYGYRLPKAWVDVYKMKSLTLIIKEHSAVDLGEFAGVTIVAFGVLFCGLLLLTVPVKRFRIVWILALVWFVLACMRVRHAPLFTVAALVVLADFFAASRIGERLVRQGSDLFQPTRMWVTRVRWSTFVVPLIAVSTVLTLQTSKTEVPVVGHGWARLNPKIWPVEALPQLRALEYHRTNGTRIFCEYTYGGFMIYHTPGYEVFIDDRCELFGDDFLIRYVVNRQKLEDGEFADPNEPFAAWQREFGEFDFALVENGGGFDVALAKNPLWEAIPTEGIARLYQKRSR